MCIWSGGHFSFGSSIRLSFDFDRLQALHWRAATDATSSVAYRSYSLGKKAISKRSKPRSREGNTYVGHPERAKFYGALWVNCLCSIRQKIHKLGRRWIWCGGEHDRFKNWNCTSDCAMRTCWRPWRRLYLLELKCVRVIESLENKCLNHLLRSWWNNLSVITICQVQQIPTRIIAHRNDRTN